MPPTAKAQQAARTAAFPAFSKQVKAAESQAASLHGLSCSPSPSPKQLEALSGQGGGATVGAVLPASGNEKGAFCKLEEGRQVYRPKEEHKG